jgi:hypothetical protein
MTQVHVEEIEKYKEALARGEYWDSLDTIDLCITD